MWLVVFLWNTEADLVVGLHHQGCHKRSNSVPEKQRWKRSSAFGCWEDAAEAPWRAAGCGAAAVVWHWCGRRGPLWAVQLQVSSLLPELPPSCCWLCLQIWANPAWVREDEGKLTVTRGGGSSGDHLGRQSSFLRPFWDLWEKASSLWRGMGQVWEPFGIGMWGRGHWDLCSLLPVAFL